MTGLLLGLLCPLCARPATEAGMLVCGHAVPDLSGMTTQVHRLTLPYPHYPRYPALSLNARGNRWATNSDVQAVRHDVYWLAREAKCLPGRHVTVHLAWSPRRRNGADVDNLVLLYKACCDGLARGARRPTVRNPGVAVGLDLVPDDRPAHMSKLMPVILPAGEPPGMWLTVVIHR